MKQEETKITETKVETSPINDDTEVKPEVETENKDTSKETEEINVSNDYDKLDTVDKMEDKLKSSNQKIQDIEMKFKSFVVGATTLLIAFMFISIIMIIVSNHKYNQIQDKLNNIASQSDANYNDINDSVNTINEQINQQNLDIDNINNDINNLNDSIDNINENIDEEIDDIYEKIEEVEQAKAQKKLQQAQAAAAAAQVQRTTYAQSTDPGVLTSKKGVNYYGDQKETYYNLNMNGVVNNAHNNGISGEYWVREDGTKMFGEYVIVAANQDVHPYGSTVETSLGTGIVLDTGGFAVNNPTQVDIATNW